MATYTPLATCSSAGSCSHKDGACTGHQQPQPAATLDEYIARAPEEMREQLQSMLSADREQRKAMIAKLVDHPSKAFPVEVLEKKPTVELAAMLALAYLPSPANSQPAVPQTQLAPNYAANLGGGIAEGSQAPGIRVLTYESPFVMEVKQNGV